MILEGTRRSNEKLIDILQNCGNVDYGGDQHDLTAPLIMAGNNMISAVLSNSASKNWRGYVVTEWQNLDFLIWIFFSLCLFFFLDRGSRAPSHFYRVNTVKSALNRSNETVSVAYNCKLSLITVSMKQPPPPPPHGYVVVSLPVLFLLFPSVSFLLWVFFSFTSR